MSWMDDIEKELASAREALRTGNAGRARTCSRRAAGIALTEFQRRNPSVYYGQDYVRQLRGLADDAGVPDGVRNAADRLQAKLAENFTSMSAQPLEDARIIIAYVQVEMTNSDNER
ncbi:MAG: hypothetical protein A3G43_09965 [Ignavibacteria bacterium RIFCSPLOWO2_12_FULL_56_21]|nr:MAG: hypothetical protein A3G43_09965 [Ignavibacteria bacterium RIFCSPLOWO2_12_FULL_56_21]